MKYAYTHNMVDSVGVKGAVTASLCSDWLQSIRVTTAFVRIEQNPIFDP